MSYSFSDLNTYLRCPKAFYYKTIRKIQRKRRDQNLRQGTMIHRLLMAGYLALQRGYEDWSIGTDDEYVQIASEISEKWSEFPAEAAPEREMLDESIEIVERFFHRHNSFEGWTILHVEEEFSVEIDGFTITFTPDLVVRDPNGNVWIVDHKSVGRIDDTGVPFSSQQSLLYLAGVRTFYPECKGFIFNYLRKKLPTQPKLNKTKNKESGLRHVSYLNTIDTEYGILYSFMKEEAPELLDEPNHRMRLAELRDQTNKFFSTQRVLTNQAGLDQIVEETSWTLDSIARDTRMERFVRVLQDDNGYTSCRKCEFESICAAEMLDLNTEIVLRDYEPRDPKNPYESDDDD